MMSNISAQIAFKTHPPFLSKKGMQDFIDAFYRCPKCDEISHGWFVNQDIGKAIQEFGLMCRHRFPVEPQSIIKVNTHKCFVVYLGIEVRDRNGVLLQRMEQRSESFVQNFAVLMSSAEQEGAITNGLTDAGTNTIAATTTSTKTSATPTGGWLGTVATAGAMTLGMAVGTGTSAPTTSDGILTTPIANGNGAGQLAYGAETYTNPSSTSGTTTWVDARLFTNNSGGTIGITEVGLFGAIQSASSGTGPVMILHDKLPSTVNLLNTTSTTGSYTFSTSV